MAKSGARIKGLEQVKKAAAEAAKRYRKAVAVGLYLEGSNLMAASKRLVPVDLGTLKGSGYVTMPQEIGHRTVVELGYGGPAKDYAVPVHERLDLQHPEGGRAKYLESAIDERSPQILGNIKSLAQAAFKAGQKPKRGPTPTDPWKGGEE